MDIVAESHFNRLVKVYKNRPKHVADMLAQAVAHYGQREALVYEDRRLTYEQMAEQAERIATNLYQSFSVRKGDRVALLLGNGIEFALCVFACARLGAIVVPLNTRLQEKELSFMINHSGAGLVLVDDEFIPKVDQMRELGTIEKVKHFFQVGEAALQSGYDSYEKLLAPQSVDPKVEVHEDDPLFIMYTSGTTGLPKGAVGSHLGVIHSALNYEQMLKTDYTARTLIAVPLFHVTGLIGQLLHMVKVGGTSVLMRRYKTEPFIRLIAKEKITFLFNVPTIYTMMLSSPEFSQYTYDSIRSIAYGGAPMSTETIEKLKCAFPQVVLHNTYGATETSSPTAIMPMGQQDRKSLAVGVPVPGSEVKVVNEQGEPCAAGEIGELWIKGAMVIEGYWNNPQANATSFVDSYWCSGDLAKLDEDGYIYILDRKKDMINRGGEKVFSVEVENVLYQYPKVFEAAVAGLPHPLYGEVVGAFLVPKTGEQISQEEIQSFVALHLADYKVPAVVHILENLPRNPGGKVLKNQLKELVSS